jgi:hypothetical protein
MDFDALVLRDGDRVTATGLLVRNDQGDWLQPHLPMAAPVREERRIESVWRGAVRITGADFAILANRFEQHGAVQGSATVTGVWSGDQLRIDQQTPPRSRAAWVHPWVIPPCPPPPGGWPPVTPRGDMLLEYNLGDLQGTGAAVAVTLFRPSKDQAVLVVAASDQAAVEARLRPQLGVLLCVVPSRWTKAQLDEIRDYLWERHEQWQLYEWGSHHTEDGQARMTARLARVLPQIGAWADSLPAGILALDPWLAPQQPASLSGLLCNLAHVRQARSRCLQRCPGVAVIPLSRPPHRACSGHVRLISLVANPHLAGDGPRPVRAGCCLTLGS